MTLAFAILLVRVLNVDLLVAQELSVHRLDGGVRGLKRIVRHESESLARPVIRVAHDFRSVNHHPERAEGVVQQLFVDVCIEVTDEQVFRV